MNTTDSLPNINFLWIGPRLSTMEVLSLTSFLDQGHPVTLFVYDEVQNVPARVTLADASTILSRSRIFRVGIADEKGSFANFADLFRYALLWEKGGWWCDCDVVCMAPFHFAQAEILATTSEGSFGIIANNCVIKCPARSELMRRCRTEAEALAKPSTAYGATGPLLMNRLVRELGYHHALARPETFCPVNWNCCHYLVEAPRLLPTWTEIKNRLLRPHLVPRFTRQTVALHLWADMWKQSGWDKNGEFPRRSIYERYKRRHRVPAAA